MTTSPLLGNAALMRRAMAGEDLMPLAQTLLARAQANEHDAHALMDLATLLQFRDERRLALQLQTLALRQQRHYTLPARQPPANFRLLALMAPGDLMTNTPLDCLLEHAGADVTLEMIYLEQGEEFDARKGSLPAHDAIIIALGAAQPHVRLLDHLDVALQNWPHPVLNRPRQTSETARDIASQKLAGIPGLHIPPTLRIPRQPLYALAHGEDRIDTLLAGCDFPLIIRPLDAHGGQSLEKMETPADLIAYLARHPDSHFFLSPFIDYCDTDGIYRKYRIALIDGVPHAVHLAISAHWKIHYLNAGMDESAAKRAEEARFMAQFDTGFAHRHAAALHALHQRMALDYLVIDCACMPDTAPGSNPSCATTLLIFEVDTGAVVHDFDPPALYPYKSAAMQRIFHSFRALLEDRCRRSGDHISR